VVEGARLESVCTLTGTGGSNPSLSASLLPPDAPPVAGWAAKRMAEHRRGGRHPLSKCLIPARHAHSGEGSARDPEGKELR
jgi:hypothetical protein